MDAGPKLVDAGCVEELIYSASIFLFICLISDGFHANQSLWGQKT
jgi:hypothetical protein